MFCNEMVGDVWYVEVFPLDDRDSRGIKALISLKTYYDEINLLVTCNFWLFGVAMVKSFLIFTSISHFRDTESVSRIKVVI
jgi:hypothetical protein